MMILLFLATYVATPATPSDVLGMMADIPALESGGPPGHFDRVGDAKEIADAIAEVAPTRETAALMAVYAAWESGNRKCAQGDGGKSFGTWQLRGTSRYVACTPLLAAREWLQRATDAETLCDQSPLEERLAVIASGSCSLARRKVRHRWEVAMQVAGVRE